MSSRLSAADDKGVVPSQSASLTALPEGEPRHLRRIPSSVSFGATFPTGGKARDVIFSIIRLSINFTCRRHLHSSLRKAVLTSQGGHTPHPSATLTPSPGRQSTVYPLSPPLRFGLSSIGASPPCSAKMGFLRVLIYSFIRCLFFRYRSHTIFMQNDYHS